jgi:cupin 2 domain-containing protein
LNFFKDIPDNLQKELFETIFKTDKFRIERIVSDGHNSPEEFWYNQDENEWIIVLKGNAEIEFEDEIVTLKKGDYQNITKHKKHKVKSTSKQEKTVWLAIFYN